MSDRHYEPKDAVALTMRGTLVLGSAGALMSAVQNSLSKQNLGTMGFITKTGSTIGLFAAVGGSYMFAKNAMANLREKDDSYNPTVGGFVAGAVMGTRFRTMPAVLGYASMCAVVLGIFDYTGGSLKGVYRDINLDEVSRKEMIRTSRRRPIEEIVADVGESRIVRAPGYDERRAERLRERYGVEVPQS